MTAAAEAWFARRTSRAADWPTSRVLAVKGAHRISVVIPARNEEATVGEVVRLIRTELMTDTPVVDELLVMDSLSRDGTAAQANAAGADVHSVADVVPELGVQAGKGEALWKSLFVTTGDILVFVDADLTMWGSHFVTSLLGPLLTNDEVLLAKGFYDRMLDLGSGGVSLEGGRVTELVARPLLAIHRPNLSRVVQPLAGEWAIRRSLFASLPVPVGYGVELSTLLDTHDRHGLDAIAQVDLGSRAHKHQNLHDLGVMASELMTVAGRRVGGTDIQSLELPRMSRDGRWSGAVVPVTERPPAAQVNHFLG